MSKWQPQPGELVELNGEWIFLRGHWPMFPFVGTGDHCYLLGDGSEYHYGDGDSPTGRHAKPLLPASKTAAEAWEALKGLPGATMASALCIDVRMEASTYRIWHDLRTRTFVDQSLNDDYAARGRDWQKEGAIREWLGSGEAGHAE